MRISEVTEKAVSHVVDLSLFQNEHEITIAVGL